MAGRSFRCSGAVLINGQSYPFHEYAVEVNAYSMDSTIDVTLPRRMKRKGNVIYRAPDFSSMSQRIRPLPIAIRAGYEAGPSPNAPVPLIGLEQGFVDQTHYVYHDQTIQITGRSTASIFESIQVSEALPRNITGSQLVQQYFSKYNVPLVLGAPSPVNSGKSSIDALQVTTTRDRTLWDEMSAAAVDDGFILTVHNGVGYYGPPAKNSPTKTITWGKRSGICKELEIDHAARRAHNMQVQVVSIVRHVRASYKVTGAYGNANAQDGEILRFYISGLNRSQCKQKAQAIYYDLATKELTGKIVVVPDVDLLQMISRYGANFAIALNGDVEPTHQLSYAVRRARVNIDMTSDEPELLCEIDFSNLNPVQQGAELV